jgi:OFA family oxalate/formate antiporter-like MFS transporter
MSKQSSSYGWVVTFAGTGINLALGALYAWSVFKKPLANAFDLSDKSTALPYSVAIIVFALMMVPAGRLQDKIGPRVVATISGILVGLGFIISSFATPGNALPYLVLGFGVLAGAGIGFGYAAATPPAIKWFPPEKKGLIVGLVVGGFGLASVYVAPLTDGLIKSKSPNPATIIMEQAPGAEAQVVEAGMITMDQAREQYSKACSNAFRILGILFMAITVVFAQLLKNPPAGYKPEPIKGAKKADAKAKPKAAAADYSLAEMLKTPQFYLMWIMFVFSAGAGLMVISFMAKLAAELNTAGKIAFAGFVFVAILAIGNASGRIISGTLSDKIGRTTTMFIVFIVQAAVMAMFPRLESTLVFVIASLLVGFCYGSCLSLFPSTTADYFGMKNLGLNYGLVFTAWGVGGFIMPLIAGAIKDSTGSYTNSFYVASAICVVAALMSFLLKAPAAASAPEAKGKGVPAPATVKAKGK